MPAGSFYERPAIIKECTIVGLQRANRSGGMDTLAATQMMSLFKLDCHAGFGRIFQMEEMNGKCQGECLCVGLWWWWGGVGRARKRQDTL